MRYCRKLPAEIQYGGGGQRLQLIRSKKNSATPSIPRNTGIRFSRGEYVLFVDNDDAITKTALDELYPIAKKFDADVVYCEKYYPVEYGEKFSTDKRFLKAAVRGNIKYDLLEIPALNSNDIENRIKDYLAHKFWIAPWNYLIRKKFMVVNDICFPELRYGDDNFFVLFLVCLAKNIVRVPNTIYVYRNRKDSLSHSQSPEINVRRYTDHFFQGVHIVNKFAEKFTFLKNRPDILYAIFEWLAKRAAYIILPLYSQIPAWQLEPLIRKELDKIEDTTALTAFIFNRMNIFNLQLNQSNAIINQMNYHIQQQNQIIRQLQAQVKSLQEK